MEESPRYPGSFTSGLPCPPEIFDWLTLAVEHPLDDSILLAANPLRVGLLRLQERPEWRGEWKGPPQAVLGSAGL